MGFLDSLRPSKTYNTPGRGGGGGSNVLSIIAQARALKEQRAKADMDKKLADAKLEEMKRIKDWVLSQPPEVQDTIYGRQMGMKDADIAQAKYIDRPAQQLKDLVLTQMQQPREEVTGVQPLPPFLQGPPEPITEMVNPPVPDAIGKAMIEQRLSQMGRGGREAGGGLPPITRAIKGFADLGYPPNIAQEMVSGIKGSAGRKVIRSGQERVYEEMMPWETPEDLRIGYVFDPKEYEWVDPDTDVRMKAIMSPAEAQIKLPFMQAGPGLLTIGEAGNTYDKERGTFISPLTSRQKVAEDPDRYVNLSNAQVDKIHDLQNMYTALTQLNDLSSELLTGTGKWRFWESLKDFPAAYSQSDPRFTNYEALRSNIATLISRGTFGNVGAQTENDRMYAMKLTPSAYPLQDDPRVAAAKIAYLAQLTEDRRRMLLGEKPNIELRKKIAAFVKDPNSIIKKVARQPEGLKPGTMYKDETGNWVKAE